MKRSLLHLVAVLFSAAALPVAAQDKSNAPPDNSHVNVNVQNAREQIAFERQSNGHVELTVTEEQNGNKTKKTYKADSLDEFNRQYPDISQKYQVDRMASGEFWTTTSELSQPSGDWDTWKKSFEEHWFWDNPQRSRSFDQWRQKYNSEDLDQWMNEQHRLFEEFRALPAPPMMKASEVPPGRRFGVAIRPLDEALADQLDLERQQGVVVMDVSAGSPAEKAGIRQNDIILKLDGAALHGPDEFRRLVHDALTRDFKLDIMRKGKMQTIEVKAPPSDNASPQSQS